MSKRKLTKLQSRRLQEQHSKRIKRASVGDNSIDDSSLGPERAGLVIAHYGTMVNIEDEETGTVERCHLRANLKSIVAGDKIIWRSGKPIGVVVSVLSRNTELLRPDNFGKLKPVAANVDQMIITIAPKPEPFSNLIDRYLVAAEINRIVPVLVINKSDLLLGEIREKILKLSVIYSKLGYKVLTVSAHTESSLKDLRKQLTDKVSIFVGQSGVGKSSLVKSLIPEQDVKVGSLSDGKDKGRHTTTHSELFRFPSGGAFIDSPGIREFGLWHVDKEQVTRGFIEIGEAALHCQFRNCRHKNDPGCAVQAAVKEKKISAQRFKSYSQIIASLSDVDIKKQN